VGDEMMDLVIEHPDRDGQSTKNTMTSKRYEI
jgi:hypothetical protein